MNISNPTSGIADPYWYEWAVGLNYAIDMLNPDNNIESISFQVHDLQGLDDVVIKYNDKTMKCIQVKHTRDGDSLTFSNLLQKKKGQSYLSKFARDWLHLENKGTKVSQTLLYTNRKMGDRAIDQNNLYRPALTDFWPHFKKEVKDASSLSEIQIKDEWRPAWNKFLDELSILKSDELILNFLKSLEIEANQPELDELRDYISSKLETYFGTNIYISNQLFNKLCYALLQWTTTLREKEEINLEDLYTALSLEFEKYRGIYSLPVNEPFFNSRAVFAEELEAKITGSNNKVVFLSGEPGTGKTNISSYLVNKQNSIISLRYYTFKPLTLNNPYLSADKGGSAPEILWGDLLIQLKGLLKGNLAKYKVPISIEMISSIDYLRSEVMRLAVALSNETKKKTVILIDGIDHAARSGEKNTFLDTLISPDNIPDSVCFIIVGQEMKGTLSYPIWFEEESVLKVEVPKITKSDIDLLCKDQDIMFTDTDSESISEYIYRVTSGNTLLSIFSISEAKKCNTLKELEMILEEKNIAQGITAYYEYIWKSSLSFLPEELFFLKNLLAGVFCLIQKRINVKELLDMFPHLGINHEIWNSILNNLYPLIIQINGQYGVFHNDFRIYLEKVLTKDKDTFIDISSKLADYLLKDSADPVIRHQQIFDLLHKANREKDYITVFNPNFIREAFEYKRPYDEIQNQINLVLTEVNQTLNSDNLINLSISITTLNQLLQGIQWASIDYYPTRDKTILLENEKYMIPYNHIKLRDIKEILDNILYLIEQNELERAERLNNKSVSNLCPVKLIKILKDNNERVSEENGALTEDIQSVLYNYGTVNALLENKIEPSELNEDEKSIFAYYNKGYLKTISQYTETEDISNAFTNIGPCFSKDYEEFILEICENCEPEFVIELIHRSDLNTYSYLFTLKIYYWAIKNKKIEHFNVFKSKIFSTRFSQFQEQKSFDKSFEPILILVANLSFEGEKFEDILSEFNGLNLARNDEQLNLFSNYIKAAAVLGDLYRSQYSLNTNFSPEEFKENIHNICYYKYIHSLIHFDLIKASQFLLIEYIYIIEFLPVNFEKILLIEIKSAFKIFKNIQHLDIFWPFLAEYKEFELLEKSFDYWMLKEGEVWNLELAAMHELATSFIEKSEDIISRTKIEEAQHYLAHKMIGYIGRKDDSLLILLEWFEMLTQHDNTLWETLGIDLLNISFVANEKGDNRASPYIEYAVASSAALSGPQSLSKFIALRSFRDDLWIRSVFEGIISLMEYHTFSDEECIALIELINNYFPYYEGMPHHSKNTLNNIYFSDVRDAIVASKKREGNESFISMLELEHPEIFKIPTISRDSYKINERFFLKAPDTVIAPIKSTQEIVEELKEYFYSNPGGYLDIKKIETSLISIEASYSLKNKKKIYEEVYKLVSQRKNQPWYFDGVGRIYKIILQYLKPELQKDVLTSIIQPYMQSSSLIEGNIYSLSIDLELYICYYSASLPLEKRCSYFEMLINMHKLWITGFGNITFPENYNLKKEHRELSNWKDFFEML